VHFNRQAANGGGNLTLDLFKTADLTRIPSGFFGYGERESRAAIVPDQEHVGTLTLKEAHRL
jgi:hypothetical protein